MRGNTVGLHFVDDLSELQKPNQSHQPKEPAARIRMDLSADNDSVRGVDNATGLSGPSMRFSFPNISEFEPQIPKSN
jgi:hypothetical protein